MGERRSWSLEMNVLDSLHLQEELKGLIPNLFRERGVENEENYSRFSALIINGNGGVLIDYIFDKMVEPFTENGESDLFLDPHNLSHFFLNLAFNWPFIIINSLKDKNYHKRYKVTSIIKSLFALTIEIRDIDVAPALARMGSNDVWSEFLARFTDASVEIRILCLKAAAILLQTQPSSSTIAADVRACLTSRLCDPNPSVRIEAIGAVEVLSEVALSSIRCPKLMMRFSSRAGDIDFEVRCRAIRSVGIVYALLVHKNDPRIVRLNFVFKLSSACLWLYKDLNNEEEKAVCELVFEDSLIDVNNGDIEQKAQNLLNLVAFCDKKAIRGMIDLLHKQSKMRLEVNRVLDLLTDVSLQGNGNGRHSSRTNSNGASHRRSLGSRLKEKKELKSILRNLGHRFPQTSCSGQLLWTIFGIKLKNDANLLGKVKSLFALDSSLTFAEANEIRDEFLGTSDSLDFEERENELKEEMLVKELVIVRTNPLMMNRETLAQILVQMKTFESAYSVKMASLLVMLSNIYTPLFGEDEVVDSLLDLPLAVLSILVSDSVRAYFRCEDHVFERMKERASYRSSTPRDIFSS